MYKFEWVTSTSVNFWVDDKLYKTITGSKVVPEFGRLVLAAWFPNAWAGTPDFDTCEMMVDYVHSNNRLATPCLGFVNPITSLVTTPIRSRSPPTRSWSQQVVGHNNNSE